MEEERKGPKRENRTFYLSQSVNKLVDDLAKAEQISASSALTILVRAGADLLGKVSSGPAMNAAINQYRKEA